MRQHWRTDGCKWRAFCKVSSMSMLCSSASVCTTDQMQLIKGSFWCKAKYCSNADPQIGTLVQPFAKAFGALQLGTAFIAQKSFADPEEAGAASTDYLHMFRLVA